MNSTQTPLQEGVLYESTLVTRAFCNRNYSSIEKNLETVYTYRCCHDFVTHKLRSSFFNIFYSRETSPEGPSRRRINFCRALYFIRHTLKRGADSLGDSALVN